MKFGVPRTSLLVVTLFIVLVLEIYSSCNTRTRWSPTGHNNTQLDYKNLDEVIIKMVNKRDIHSIKRLVLDYSKNWNKQQTDNGLTRQPLLTLFSTFNPSSENPSSEKKSFFVNTFRIWSLLQPEVQSVLYCPDSKCMQVWKPYVKQYNWKQHLTSKCSKSDNIPILKHMFLDTMAKYDSTFYAYSNGDILFDASLLETLKVLKRFSDEGEKFLIVGQRSNYKMNATKMKEFANLQDVAKAMEQTRLFSPWAEDYFIYNRAAVNWSEIPEVVVGRRGYDNWLVYHGLKKAKLAVIDASKTVSALHQTGSDGTRAGHKHRNPDYNMKILKSFDYFLGLTSCAVMETNRTKDGKVIVAKRPGCEKLIAKHRFTPTVLNFM